MKKTTVFPVPVLAALRRLGQDIKEARIRRRLTLSLIAERAGISYATVRKVEQGEPTVSFGIYAKVLFALGLLENLHKIAAVETDEVGRILEAAQLPKRVRYKKAENPYE